MRPAEVQEAGGALRRRRLTYVKDPAGGPVYQDWMLDEQFNKERAQLVRELADRADPFIRRRLMDLLTRYEAAKTSRRLPSALINPGSAASDEG